MKKRSTQCITLDELVETVCARIGIKGRAIQWTHAEPCMDVDKPHQLELIREDMAKQQRKEVLKAKRAAEGERAKTDKPATKRSSGTKKVAALAATRSLTKSKAAPKRK